MIPKIKISVPKLLSALAIRTIYKLMVWLKNGFIKVMTLIGIMKKETGAE